MNKILVLGLFWSFSFYASGQKSNYFSRTPLSDSVNSKQDESGAVLSADGKSLYFVRSFYPGNIGGVSGMQDVYVSRKKDDGSWSVSRNMGAPLNDEFHNAVCGISKDGNRFYLNSIKVRQDKTVPGISLSVFEDGFWSVPVSVSQFKFPEKGFFTSFVSFDEEFAIVSFEGTNSKGLEDLYVMKKGTNGKFGDPVSLGDKINSAGFETSPILSLDGKTLYFSSNGFGGSGDGDIFKTTRLDDTWNNWSKPENLGPRINTAGFDGSFSLDADGNAYYVSGEGSAGQGDIFTISMNLPPPSPVLKSEVVKMSSTDSLAALSAQKFEQEKIMASKLAGNAIPQRIDTFGQALFEFNSIVINAGSKESLQAVVRRLKKNKSYRVQVEGHTDDVGSELYNQRLSYRRALSVKRFLVKHGIAGSKIRTQGFGELNPISDNDSEAGRSSNRRVEIKYFIK